MQGVESEAEMTIDQWAMAARKLFDMMIYKPHGSYNCCRICGGTWWDNERPRHRLDCSALAAIEGRDP